jgi:glycerol uptake facilitator-like aquaporin
MIQPVINYWAVLAAGVGAWIAGAVWYGVLGKHWLAALGKTKADLMGPSGKPRPGPFVLSFVADLIIAFVLAGIVGAVGAGKASILAGIATGALMWTGFVVTTLAVNNAYAGRKTTLTVIDAGHWLLAMVVAGAIVGAFG